MQDVEALLANHPNELKFYQSLTPGYKKIGHVIFFCKTRKTREKRLEKMIEILSQGYKTIDLFRKKKK
ncbi:YdeI/OmpD-associated family protein [Bacillus shihchuchen]